MFSIVSRCAKLSVTFSHFRLLSVTFGYFHSLLVMTWQPSDVLLLKGQIRGVPVYLLVTYQDFFMCYNYLSSIVYFSGYFISFVFPWYLAYDFNEILLQKNKSLQNTSHMTLPIGECLSSGVKYWDCRYMLVSVITNS